MSRYEVANLRIRLGEYKIKQTGETEIWESKAARVVRHKEFSQNTLVNIIKPILYWLINTYTKKTRFLMNRLYAYFWLSKVKIPVQEYYPIYKLI